ncbi:hypothetical protein DFH08DRAFT_979042 [Mycena albidolilacea]|uniref:Uncharacterized protein n=1 Tax=Mycena albidolilacea TaxID=1033008 RepID=A0AAD6YY97_9AGAR|nr:hypothetical protein DFH08DRAFT_979042 [Mycena albidolilacea]
MPIVTRSSARQTRSTAATRSMTATGTHAPKKNCLEVKIRTRAREGHTSRPVKQRRQPSRLEVAAAKTKVEEPIAEEDFADVSNDSNAKAAHVPVEDPSSNDSIPTMPSASLVALPTPERPVPRPHHNEVPIPPPDAALNDLANDPFNLSGRVASRRRVQGSWDMRTQQQRGEDDEEGHADDEGLEGLEVEEQEYDVHTGEERFEGEEGDDLYNFKDMSVMGYDDTIDLEQLRAFIPPDPPRRHSASPRRGSSAKSPHRRRHSIDSPTRPRPHAGSPAGDDHRGRARTHGIGKSAGVQSASQKAVLESELSHSSDDYSDDQAQKARIKNWRVAQGGRVSPSIEDEDEEDEWEFEKEVERNGFHDERGADERVSGADERVSPSTEDEDEEDEQEYKKEVGRTDKQVEESNTAEKGGKRKSKKSADVVDGESGPVAAAGGASKPRRKRKAKGKAKMVDSGRDSDCVVEENSEEDGDGILKAGAISGAIKDRLYELHDDFTTAVDKLARSCGKSSLTLHQMVGNVIKTPRSLNAWNIWQRYFTETTPKEQKLKGADYTKQARAAFIAACRVSDDFVEEKLKDSDAVFKHLPWLLEWNQNLTQQAVIAVREKGKLKPKLRREIKPVTQIAKQMLDTYGVHVWGYVIDPEGQGSFVFGVGDDFKEMRALQLHNLNQQVKDQEHTFGMIEMRKRGQAACSIPIQNLDPHEHEGPRDAFRRQFTSIIGGQLWAFCRTAGTLSGQDVDKTKFQMKWNTKFINVARESKCRIINYPAALQAANQIIGTRQFNVKRIKSATFEKFMSSLVDAHGTRAAHDDDDIMQIVAWEQDEIDLPLDEQGDVAVVVDEHGVGLVTVKQSEGYAKEVKKQAEKAEKAEKRKRKKERGTGAQQQDEEVRYTHPPTSRRHRDDGDNYYREDSHRRHHRVYSRSHSPSHAESPRHYRVGADSRSCSPPRAGSAHHNRPRTDLRSRSPPRAESSHHNRPHPNSRFRTPPRAGASHNYRPCASSRSRSPAPRAGSSHQYEATYRDDYSWRANTPPLARSPPRAPQRAKSPRQQGARWPLNNDARQWDDATPRPHPDGCAESSQAPPTVPPRLDLSRMDAVAARVATDYRDHRAQGPDEKRGPKRKAPHNEGPELVDRDYKRHRGTEEAPPLLKCRIIVNKKRGCVFFATHLQNVDRPIRADGVIYVHNPERRVWKQIGPNVAPVLATEDDRKQYAKELEDFGL